MVQLLKILLDYLYRQFEINLIWVINIILFKTSKRPTNIQVRGLKVSGYIGKSSRGLDYSLMYQKLEQGYRHLRLGLYFKGVKVMQECLLSIYEHYQINLDTWTPKFVSINFGERIGHKGHLGTLLIAQKLGLIDDIERIIPVGNNLDQEQISNMFGADSKLKIVNSHGNSRPFETPDLWHMSERLWLIKLGSEFIPGLDFTNKVFTKFNENNSDPMFELNDLYNLKAQNMINKLGLPKGQPFIALHIRNSSWVTDHRKASISNYLPAVQDLIGKGYFVVQFGTDIQKPIIQHTNMIVIQGPQSQAHFLTPYILAKCKFFINTCSGPTYIAPLYGTPVLQTNCVAIGITTPVLSRNSIHLPKTFFYKQEKLSLAQILKSKVGYAEGSYRDFYKFGYSAKENTGDEILMSSRYMLESLETNHKFSAKSDKANSIRTTFLSPASGNFSPAYIAENESWFLR